MFLVGLKPLLGKRKGCLADDGGYRDLDPVRARSFMLSTVARGKAAAQPKRPRDALPWRLLCLAEARRALVGRIGQHCPYHRPLPTPGLLARRNALLVEETSDRADAEALRCITLKDRADDLCFGFNHCVIRCHLIGLAHITIAEWGAAQHTDLTSPRAMAFAAAGTLKDLRTLVFRNHALELQQKLILSGGVARRLDKEHLHARTCKLFREQNLICVFATQPIRRMNENRLNLSLRRKIANPFQARPNHGSTAIAFVLKHPLIGHAVSLLAGEGDQRRRLAGNRVLLLLLVGGYAGVDCCHLHHRLLSNCRACPRRERSRERESRRPVQAWRRANDQSCVRGEWRVQLPLAHPWRRIFVKNAESARPTISPKVNRLAAEYARKSRMTFSGSFIVIACDGSTVGTRCPIACACSR